MSVLRKDGANLVDDCEHLKVGVCESLKKAYKQHLLPLEKESLFHQFYDPPYEDANFDSKPIVMFIGQYSTGRTSFIKHLLGKDYPGIMIGPQPTTDSFIAIMHGDAERIIPGNVLAADPTKPFQSLNKFGKSFLDKFRCSTTDSAILETVTLVDTPGILARDDQSNRGYDFISALQWFAERADLIFFLFDSQRLDISTELQRCLQSLSAHTNKIRIVLNKMDTVGETEFHKVHGALIWALAKVIKTPEVVRVYHGSYGAETLPDNANNKIFEKDRQDLLQELEDLPRTRTIRKLDDMLDRVTRATQHARVMNELSDEWRKKIFKKDAKKKELIAHLARIHEQVQQKYNLMMPKVLDLSHMQKVLQKLKFKNIVHVEESLFEKLKKFQDEISQYATVMSPARNIERQVQIAVV